MEGASVIGSIPVWALAGFGVLVIVQLTLQVIALVQLARTPAERVTINGHKWVWALIIILGEILGALIWFFVGRKPVQVDVAAPIPAPEQAGSAVDSLYGDSDRTVS